MYLDDAYRGGHGSASQFSRQPDKADTSGTRTAAMACHEAMKQFGYMTAYKAVPELRGLRAARQHSASPRCTE